MLPFEKVVIKTKCRNKAKGSISETVGCGQLVGLEPTNQWAVKYVSFTNCLYHKYNITSISYVFLSLFTTICLSRKTM